MTAGDGALGVTVGILMGSDTDLPVMSEASKMLEKFGIRLRDGGGIGAPDASPGARICDFCGGAWGESADRRCWCGGTSCWRNCGKYDATCNRRAARDERTQRARRAARDRADAGRNSSSDDGDRQGGSSERGDFCRRDSRSGGRRNSAPACSAQGRSGSRCCGKERKTSGTIEAKEIVVLSRSSLRGNTACKHLQIQN